MMNLNKLFETQKILDDHIEKEHPRQEDEDRLSKKILALQVELGECANEWRWFKFWSKDQEPRTNIVHKDSHGQCAPVTTNPLLEEYVDCLHFILSIGLEKEWTHIIIDLYLKADDITNQFLLLFSKIGDFAIYKTKGNYYQIIELFKGLGEMLGFTWEQIEEAYMKKNEINHERQDNGY